MDLNDVRFKNNGNLNQQQLAQLHQQQLEHIHQAQMQQQQQQQQHLHQQMSIEQQKQNLSQNQQQSRRRIRKQKNNAGQSGVVEGHEEIQTEKKSSKKKHVDENVSIEEALKALTLTPEGTNNAMKTPVSVLQELLSRRGITPAYDLVQIEGAIHEPTFRYRVTYGNKDAMGAGKSKKEAKHQAARNLIDKLTGVQIADQILPPASNGNKDVDGKVNGNPIGWLQELCMARRWPPPFYETQSEVGLPHERQFTIACHVSTYSETGRGKSKKEAKRLAAHQMWQRLQDMPADTQDDTTDEINRANALSRYADLKEKRISTLTNHHSYKVSQFHKTLKANCGQNLTKLQSTCLNDPNMNFVQFLQEIATEQQFEVTFVDIEEKTYTGQFQCLVQLSTLPVAVCQGCGKTSKTAQTSAARNALEYLKIMTKI